MSENEIIILIIGISAFIYMLVSIVKKPASILRFFIRFAVALLMTYLINTSLLHDNVDQLVGYNIFSLGIMGVFGLPGVIILFLAYFV